MTSKAYSNKTQIFRQTVRRDIVLIIVFTVILLVFQSLPLFLQYAQTGIRYQDDAEAALLLISELYQYTLMPISIVLLVVLMVRSFGYMHQPVDVDLWHQLPISRLRLYGEKLAAILSLIAVPHIINFGVVFLLHRLLVPDMMFAPYVRIFSGDNCFYMLFLRRYFASICTLATASMLLSDISSRV